MEDKMYKEHCEIGDCTAPVFATLYPNDLNIKVCEFHFKERVGRKILEHAEIVDMTDEEEEDERE
jgi:hypothetical protein